MARPVERRAARDFVLDAHGLTALAAPSALANEWLEYIFEERPGSEVWVPDLVIVESTTGTPADANVNRFLKTLGSTKEAERHWLSADEASYRRALTAPWPVRHPASWARGASPRRGPARGAQGRGILVAWAQRVDPQPTRLRRRPISASWGGSTTST